MKPQRLQIHLSPENSFSVRHDVVPYFYNVLHYHPEIELVYIVKGAGTQFVGDKIHHFKSGDMILVGANLPHLWRSDEKYLLKKGHAKCEAYVIHFIQDCLGEHFFNLPENKNVLSLLKRTKQGISIKGSTKISVVKSMQQMSGATPGRRLLLFLEILQCIADSKQTSAICRQSSDFDFSPTDSEKMNKIFQHILQNFYRELTLREIAAVAHLSTNSFCRYFKSRIKKSFSKFLIEIRIGHACKLLAETNKTVAEICYECGYNNFSNFNKHFKNVTAKTPVAQRKYYQEKDGS